jgi:hypothetical protein
MPDITTAKSQYIKDTEGKIYEKGTEINKTDKLSEINKGLQSLDSWKVAALARVEADYQEQKKSLEAQKKELEEI